ncbi:hypothetical protein F5887DRAFT_1125689 [Amanita rubescens]|nr:hypothetical protein F5887DRAFT_1125689 [Amanita rubescens]
MSRPPINPDKSLAGIAVDPVTLERIVPESRRPDGSVRKELKIRKGFTPQEDVRRFRGSKQQQLDASALPKGHIIGWTPPTSSAAQADESTKPTTKSAKKNAQRKKKKAEKKQEVVPDSWDDGDEEDTQDAKKSEQVATASDEQKKSGDADGLAGKMENLKVEGS